MNCLKCGYNLTGSDGDICPECGTRFRIVEASAPRVTTAVLYTGMGFVLLFCVLQTLWFWRDLEMFNLLVMTGGSADPAALAESVRIKMIFRYLADISLGIGLICMCFSLFQMLNRVAARL